MKRRAIAAVGLLAAVALAAAVAAGATTSTVKANKLTVWLQVDAQSGWPDVVAAANQQFQKDHPGWTVEVQYQNWSDHLQKFDATLAANNAPDVIEMGNTEMAKYMFAGAFADLTGSKSKFDNSANWLTGLAKSGQFKGKVYAVPYYAGSRVITYRSDLFKEAGIKKLPTSLAQFQSDLVKVGKVAKAKGFAPMYVGGEDWYTAMSFVYDFGGSIAKTHAGKWVGNLNSPSSIAGLTAFKNFFNATQPKSSRTLDGTNPFPYTVFSQGRTAANYGPAWYTCCTGKKYTSVVKQFVMPSHTPGKSIPGFLGGSDLAVPVTSGHESEAVDWLADFTSTANEQALEKKGNIPNATNLLGNTVNERAAARSWFTPAAKHWVEIENGNILKTMLGAILTGHLTVTQAATLASNNITSVLNKP